MKFAAGDLPHLVVPYCRHALRALPELHVESSCFAYDNATVLGDGTTKVEFRCARSAAIQNSKSKGKCGSGEAGSGDISDDETAGEGSLAMQDALLSKDGSADDECCEVDGAVRDVEESAPLPQSSHGSSAGDPATPPEVRRQLFSESFAAAAGKAALGLRSADAPLTAPPTQIYKQDCSAGLHAYVPPRALAGASMLLTRRHSPGADAAVIRHCHRLDEHLPLSDLLEQAVVLGIKKAGSFTKGSLECQRWLEEVLPQIGAWHVNETSRGVYVRLMRPGPVCHLAERNYREYAGSSFRERPALKLSAICGTAEALSPAGFGRQRRGRHAPHEYVDNNVIGFCACSHNSCPSLLQARCQGFNSSRLARLRLLQIAPDNSFS